MSVAGFQQNSFLNLTVDKLDLAHSPHLSNPWSKAIEKFLKNVTSWKIALQSPIFAIPLSLLTNIWSQHFHSQLCGLSASNTLCDWFHLSTWLRYLALLFLFLLHVCCLLLPPGSGWCSSSWESLTPAPPVTGTPFLSSLRVSPLHFLPSATRKELSIPFLIFCYS